MNTVTTKISALISCIWLSSCLADSPEIVEMRRLCALDAGQKVYETVQADGYFAENEDGDGVLVLATPYSERMYGGTAYQYIEFCKDKSSDLYDVGVKLDAGCWRAEKVARSSGRCNVDADTQIKKKVISPYVEFIKNQCIALDKIEKPTARYHSEGDTKLWVDKKNNIEYGRYEGRVVDSQTGKILAKEVSYSAFKRPEPSFGCGSPKVTGLEKNIMNKEDLISLTIKRITK